jgi:YD repeat-containing protein
MKRGSAVFVVVLCALFVRAQDHPNTARGFNSESVYQFGGPDSVNVFNGNLVVPIPIGQTYRVGGNLSYGFTLVYNGQLWSYRAGPEVSHAVPQRQQNAGLGWQLTLGELYAPLEKTHDTVDPEQRWAYMGPDGGRHLFYDALHAEEAGSAAYDAALDPRVEGYTRDASYMRLVQTEVRGDLVQLACAVNRYTVEMADGTRHTFRSACNGDGTDPAGKKLRYFLELIEDRFGNNVTISYAPSAADPANATQWIITDNSGAGTARTHYVNLTKLQFNIYRGVATTSPQYYEERPVITSVDLAAFGGTRAVYQFANNTTANWRRISEPCKSGRSTESARPAWVRFLDGITLPDGSSYAMQYFPGDGGTLCYDVSGHLVVLTLPTGGKIEYEVSGRFFPQYWPNAVEDNFQSPSIGSPNYEDIPSPIDHANALVYDLSSDMRYQDKRNFSSPYYSSVAVRSRTFVRENDQRDKWSYWTCYWNRKPRDPNVDEPPKPRELIVAVDEPDGRRTLSYFTVDLLEHNDAAYPGGKRVEYGLPFTRTTNAAKASPVPGYYLSTELIDRAPARSNLLVCEIAFVDDRVAQRTYVRYEYDAPAPGATDDQNGGQPDSNRRLTGTLTVQRKFVPGTTAGDPGKWIDDTSCGGAICYSLVEYSDFDGLGHHRNETRKTNIGTAPNRTNVTRWRRPGRTPVTYVPGAANIPADYMVAAADKWLPNYFDLTSVREGPTDAITSLVCLDVNTGFLNGRRVIRTSTKHLLTTYQHVRGNVTRESFFGGEAGGPSDTCAGGPGPVYQLEHTYSHGSRATSKYLGLATPFFTLDLTIDPATGLASSSRDSALVPTTFTYDKLGRLLTAAPYAAATTAYTYATTERPAHVKVTQGGSMTEAHYYYDYFGRLVQEKRRMPGGWATIGRTYDSAGRLIEQTVPKFFGTAAYSSSFTASKSVFAHDVFDRNVKTTAPDGSIVDAEYSSGTGGWRTVVRTAHKNAQLATKTAETYDGFGRLRYATDVFDKVTQAGVTTNYTYDFGDRLTRVWSGASTDPDYQERLFAYDIAGLLVSEDHPETAPTTYTYDARGHVLTKTTGTASVLRYEYDPAERLAKVFDKTLLSKEFAYDLGRLQSQTRHNRFSNATFSVNDVFTYDTAGRVASKRTTVTETPASGTATQQLFTQNYTYTPLSLPAALNYPTCTACTVQPPARDLPLQYKDGLLTHIGSVTAPIVPAIALDARADDPAPSRPSIAYTAAGAVQYVQHASPNGTGALDTFVPDPDGLARPRQITVTSVPDCGLITVQPTDQPIGGDGTATFSMTVATGATVQWYEGLQGDTSKPRGTGATYKTPVLSATTSYWARVTSVGSSCMESTPTVVASYCPPVQITAPAADATIVTEHKLNDEVTLDVATSGSSLTYKWERVEGATVTTLAVGSSAYTYKVVSGDITKTFSIRVTVSGSCGMPVTRTMIIIKGVVEPCLVDWLMQPPGVVEVLPGESFPLQAMLTSTTADRVTSYTFHWSRDGVAPYEPTQPGPSSTYHFTVQTAAIVRVEAWANCGTVKSESVSAQTFGIVRGSCPAPTFTLNQKSAVLAAGQVSAFFEVQTQWPDLRFEWYTGESGNTRYPITDVTGNSINTGGYPQTLWVRVINECGASTDSETLTVSWANCSPVRIRRDPASADVAAGASHTLTVDAASTPMPYAYQWYVDGVAVNTPEGKLASYSIQPKKSASYWVEVTNTCHVARSRIATVRVTSCADINVSAQPADVSVNETAAVSLTIQATAAPAILYQWYEGESGDTAKPVAGAQSKTYSFAAAKTTKYWVRMSFAASGTCAVDSRTVTVNVCRTPKFVSKTADQSSSQPGNQHTLGVTVTGDNLSYVWYRGEKRDQSYVAGSGFDIVRVAPAVTTQYWAKVTSDCTGVADAVLQVDPIVISVCPVITQDPQPVTIMPGTSTVLTVAATRGDTIQWYRGPSHDISSGVLGTGASFPTPAVSTPTQFWARVTSGSCSRDSAAALVSMCGEPYVAWSAAIKKNVAYGEAQTIQIVVTPSSGVTRTFYEGTTGDVAGSRKVLGPGADGGLPIFPTQTTSYWVRAQMSGGICYYDTPTLTINVCIPTITTPPQSTSIDKVANPAATATLTVAANGGALTYQWYEGATDDVTKPIAGATGTSITVSPNAQTSYWVRVTGTCGVSRSSAAAVVSLCQVPRITRQPVGGVTTSTSQASIDVLASGDGLNFQWYEGAAGVTSKPVGGNSSLLTVTPGTTKSYWVRITGTCGTIDSAAALISIYPTIRTEPADASICSGSSATFTAAANGSPLEYQWYRGSYPDPTQPIANSNSATLTLTNITATQPVWCEVRSGTATAHTRTATATVMPGPTVLAPSKTVYAGCYTLTARVSANDEGLVNYAWYQGPVGDVANSTFITINKTTTVCPTATTQYWVRVTYTGTPGCSTVRGVTAP